MRGNDEANKSAAEERYKEAKREAKKAVARAKEKAYEDLYKRLGLQEEENGYLQTQRKWVQTLNTIDIARGSDTQKLKEALRKMGRNKAVGPDEIPIEAWRGIKLLSHTMKLWERVIERRFRRETEVSENQFGFMSGRSTMKAIHIRSLIEKYRERQKDLHLAFLDLEKAYDSVPRELIWKTLSDKGTPTRYIKVIQDMYEGARTCVRTPTGNTKYFPVDGLNGRLEQWRKALEDKGLRVSREKTEYMRCNFNKNDDHNEEIRIGDHILEPNESFRYLGSVMHKSGRIEDDVTHRIQVGWVAIRPAMLYGSECWPLTKVQANRMEVAEMRMLRWTCGKTFFDMIPNGVFRTNLRVVTIVNKMREGHLRWFGHVKRRPQSAPVRRVEALTVDGARRRGSAWRSRIRVLLSAFCAALCSLLCSSVLCLYMLCFSSVRFRCVCLLVATYLILCASLLFALWRCVLFVYACLFGPLLRLLDVDLCARFRCSFLWYVCDALSLARRKDLREENIIPDKYIIALHWLLRVFICALVYGNLVTDKALLKEVFSGSMSNKDGIVKDNGCIYMILEYGEIDLAHMLSQKWRELDDSRSTIDENWLRFYWQ
ncbi:retrovirus-related pol polyprotein LINE-1, partial [Tanacetum coccineum]